MNAIHKIDKTVEQFNMLSYGDSVAVGVSGGKDSMLLLYYLLSKREELSLTLIAANVEHGIRGEASLSDSEFVKDFCEKHDVEFRMLKLCAIEEAKEAGLGVEEYSRKKRYEFFDSLDCDKIATAHSLSDSAETVLFRLARGTSLSGVKGIPPVRGNIIRPLIGCTSEEIIAVCSELDIPYVTDESNFDSAYSRNKIRNEIIPLLKSINPGAEKSIYRFSISAAEDDEYLRREAEKYALERIELKVFRNLHISLKKRVLEICASRFGVTLDEKHLRSVLVLSEKSGKTQIKGRLFAYSDGVSLYFDFSDKNYCRYKEISKTVNAEDFRADMLTYKKEFTFYCDCDKISGNISIRSREEGDFITLPSRGVTKSLKKLYNELKIPQSERHRVPVICDGEGVIGVYGYAVSERVKADENTERYYLLNIISEDKI